jgi:hypothetical protein
MAIKNIRAARDKRKINNEPMKMLNTYMIINQQLNDLTMIELHNLSDGRRKVYIPLLARLPFNKLHFSWISQNWFID